MEPGFQKVCTKCKAMKAGEEYHKGRSLGGLFLWCIPCEKIYHQEKFKNRPARAILPIPDTKLCAKCKAVKSGTEFNAGRGADGRHIWCRECTSEATRTRHEASKLLAIDKDSPKTCCVCGVQRVFSDFNAGYGTPDGKNPRCKHCESDYKVKRKFGLSKAQYDSLLESQGGVCAICSSPPAGKRLAVDHSHLTGEIRKLLCSRCNTGLGLFGDSPESLKKAAEYLISFLTTQPST